MHAESQLSSEYLTSRLPTGVKLNPQVVALDRARMLRARSRRELASAPIGPDDVKMLDRAARLFIDSTGGEECLGSNSNE